MAVEFVQSGSNSGSSVTSLAVTLTGVTAGNSIAVAVMQSQATVATYSVTDDVDGGSYTSQITNDANSGRVSELFTFADCTGGDPEVTVTASASRVFAIAVIEVSGAGSSLTISTDSQDTSGGATKYAAASSGFSPTADSLCIAAFTFNAGTASNTVGSGYTSAYNSAAHPIGLCQYQEFSTLQANHRPEMTVGTTFRVGPAVCMFIEAGVAVASTPSRTLLGVGI